MKQPPRLLSRRALVRAVLGGCSGLAAAYLVGCEGGGGSDRPTPDAGGLATQTVEPGETPTAAPTAPASPRWRALSPSSPLPSPRRDHSLAGDGQRAFLFGGRSNGPLGDLWSFDLSGGAWTEIAGDGPPPRFGHNAVFDPARGRLVVFGGQSGGTFFNDLWAFDVAGGRWSQVEPGESGPSPRYGAAGALDPAGRIVVSHGFTNAGRFDDTWGFDLAEGTWTDASPQAPRPVERCLMRGAWDSSAGRLLMFGGQTTGVPFLGDLWELTRQGWTELAAEPKPSPRNFYAMMFDDEGARLVLFGGNTQDGPVNDLWFFDSASDSWSEQPVEGERPSSRSGHDAVWMPSARSLLVFGGRDDSGDLNDLWELSLPA